MSDNKNNNDNEQNPKITNTVETAFSETALNAVVGNSDDSVEENAEPVAEKPTHEKTVLTTFDESDSDATILSGATAFGEEDDIDMDATQVVQSAPTPETNFDADATEQIRPEEATVLAGGTEAVIQAIKPDFSPRMGVGSTINDRFTLEKLLGRGGMGEVYLAVDKRKLEAQDKNPHVAMKVLGENFKRHPQAFIALQREARKTQELAHPNIVTVYDFDRQGDSVYLTMEALNGKPMDEEIRSDARPLEQAINMIEQCAKGLAYAHEKSLVHSDLKPGNLFLTAEGNVKLLDFGIARAFKSGKSLQEQGQAEHTDTVFDAGELGALTPAYASWEMINGEEPHPSDDVYALGLIAYELVTGKHPFDKKMATKAQEEGLEAERLKGLTKNQWLAIEKALAFEREDRIQDAGEFYALFTAKSKTPLYIAASLILVAFIAVGSINFFIEPEIGPEVPFAELPQDTKDAFNAQMADAEIALKFQDYNSAIQHFDNAFKLHPYNSQVMKKADKVAKILLDTVIKPSNKVKQLELIETLMAHESLKSSGTLSDFKNTLN